MKEVLVSLSLSLSPLVLQAAVTGAGLQGV